MQAFDKIWDKVKNIIDLSWIEWLHEADSGKNCCLICTVLNGCWFADVKGKRPGQPLHPFCHCGKKPIPQPTANETAKAYCDVRKFSEYIFSIKYEKRGKTYLFKHWGYDILDSSNLKAQFEKQALEKYCKGEYTLGKLNNDGQRINIVIELTDLKNGGIKTVISGWMVRPKGLITCNTPLAGG